MRREVIGQSTLYLADCKDVVPILEPVSAIICDPPYELSDMGPGKSHFGMSLEKFNSDDYKNIVSGFDIEIFNQLEKICQPFNMFCFCSNKQISKVMAHHEEKKRITTLLIWHKINAAPFANGVWRGDIEYIVHARDSGATFEGDARQKKKVSSYGIVNDLEHPTVKPLELMKKYIKICSIEGDTILDPYMGSGTTGVACMKMGRKFIGIEINENHFNLACQRIEEASRQTDMFVNLPMPPADALPPD